MPLYVKIIVACMVALTLMSCAGRRARQAQERELMYMRQQQQLREMGPSCTSPQAGACQVCTIQCPAGQPALCTPGQSRDGNCVVEPVCKCGAPS